MHARRRTSAQPAAVALWLMEAVEEAEVGLRETILDLSVSLSLALAHHKDTVQDLRKQHELVVKDITMLDAQIAARLQVGLPIVRGQTPRLMCPQILTVRGQCRRQRC